MYPINRLDITQAIVPMPGVGTFETLKGLLTAIILALLARIWRNSQSNLGGAGVQVQNRQGQARLWRPLIKNEF